MTVSGRSHTALLSGRATATDRAPIGGLCVMAVNALDIVDQHTARTDDAGGFAIELPCGRYDLMFFDELHEPLILADVTIEEDLAYEIVRPRAESSGSRIHGVVNQPDGAPASGYTIELRDGSASDTLATVTTGRDGGFEFANCAYAFYLLLIWGDSGEQYWVPAPKPETSLEINITLTDLRPVEQLVVNIPSPTAAGTNSAFAVCFSQDDGAWHFSGGVMAPNAGYMRVNVAPTMVAVNASTWLNEYAVYVDRRPQASPLSPACPPAGYYWFTDASPDTYFLTAILPYLHTVPYSSAMPNIIGARFSQGIPYSGAWPGAPACG